MENKITVLDTREVLNNVVFNTYGTLEDPLFLAKDVAEILEERDGYTLARKIDSDEKVTRNVCTLGGVQKSTFLTEDGLYEALMMSRKPIAKQFKKEVKTILKQIRKTGGYIPVKEEETEAEIILKAMGILQATIAKKDELLELQKPKVEYAERLLTSDTSMKLGDFAKSIKIKQSILFNFLRNNSVIGTMGTNKNIAAQRYLDSGYFEIKTSTFEAGLETRTCRTTLITPKGQLWLSKKLKK